MSVPLSLLLLTAIVCLLAGVMVGRRIGRARTTRSSEPQDAEGAGFESGEHETRDSGRDGSREAERLRAQALDASLEAIVVVTPEGRVRDCNAAALSFFNRHRPEIEALDAIALRRLLAPNGSEMNWPDLVATCSPWMGDALVRLPDGSTRESLTRIVPIFSEAGDVFALVEVHRDPNDQGIVSTRAIGFPHSALLAHRMDEPLGERGDLRFLAAAFQDLDRVVRQYERLLPAMRSEDPLSEVIAGVAAETTEVTQSVDVPTLLREI
ncbi:MAG: PAS domain-containing protein, partial [Gemmatimonadaceae bacterium]